MEYSYSVPDHLFNHLYLHCKFALTTEVFATFDCSFPEFVLAQSFLQNVTF